MHDEPTLVEAAQRGDRQAFAALYDRYAPLIRAVCFDLTGDSALSDDLAQDVFLRAFHKASALRKPDSFGSWLIGIARNRVREWRRARRREDCVLSCNATQSQPAPEAQDEHLADLQEAIGRLPERFRLAVRLFYLQDLSAAEASRVMQISLSGFYAALAQARALLRARMSPSARAEE